jgi:hypothetical protein
MLCSPLCFSGIRRFQSLDFYVGVKVPRRSLLYATHRLMVMHPHIKYNWPISKDKNVMAWTRKYYLKNNYLTLRSKVKVPQRSLRYATHHLMVMHIPNKSNKTVHWKIVRMCMTIRRCVAYRNDLPGTLIFDQHFMSPFVRRRDIITIDSNLEKTIQK